MISSCRIVRFTPENIGETDTRGPAERWGIRPIHGHTPFVPQWWLFVPRRIGPTARNRTVTEHDKRRDRLTVGGRQSQSQSSVGVVSPSRQSQSPVSVASPSRQSQSPVSVASPSRQFESSVRVISLSRQIRVVGRSESVTKDSDSHSTARESVAASPTLGVGSPRCGFSIVVHSKSPIGI
jgi:hypothetical protein